MGKVQGVREKLHYDWYDCFFVPRDKMFKDALQDPRVIRYFVDVQSKTRLETNMQAAGVLPSQNMFEARALRVVASSFNKNENSIENGIFWNKEEEQPSEADVLAELIYNSVTTLLVGEKIMFEAPTFFFPSGAGVIQNGGSGPTTVSNHGQPDPMATFRFAEPVMIDSQQNFRVEISFPRGIPSPDDTTNLNPGLLANLRGPFRLWVMLDGYLTRDVQ